MSLELALAMLRLAPSLVLWDFKTDGWPPVPISKASQAQNVVGAGFSDAAAGALAGFMDFQNWCAAGPLSGFMGFQNWRMAPGPDLTGFPRPKMSLELALAMLRLGRMAPCPDLKGFPRPKMSLELAFSHAAAGTLAGFTGFQNWCAAAPLPGFMGFQNWRMAPGPDLKGFPRAGFSHAAAGALAGFMGFQNAPGPDLKGFPRLKMSLELALAMLRLAPSLVLWDFKTDGWPPAPISKTGRPKMSLWSWL